MPPPTRARKVEGPKPRSDAYTGLLVLSFLAMATSGTLLYLDYSSYPEAKPKNVDASLLPPPGSGTLDPIAKPDPPEPTTPADPPAGDPPAGEKPADEKPADEKPKEGAMVPGLLPAIVAGPPSQFVEPPIPMPQPIVRVTHRVSAYQPTAPMTVPNSPPAVRFAVAKMPLDAPVQPLVQPVQLPSLPPALVPPPVIHSFRLPE